MVNSKKIKGPHNFNKKNELFFSFLSFDFEMKLHVILYLDYEQLNMSNDLLVCWLLGFPDLRWARVAFNSQVARNKGLP